MGYVCPICGAGWPTDPLSAHQHLSVNHPHYMDTKKVWVKPKGKRPDLTVPMFPEAEKPKKTRREYD